MSVAYVGVSESGEQWEGREGGREGGRGERWREGGREGEGDSVLLTHSECKIVDPYY